MAAEDFGGKVLDAPIEIITADHQNKPDVAANIARQWYDTEQVDAIMELTSSSVGLAVQALQRQKENHNQYGCGDIGTHRQAMHAIWFPLGL